MTAPERKTLDSRNTIPDIANIRARARLLEFALLCGGGGMSLDDGVYRDAIAQQASDIAHDLDLLAESLERKESKRREREALS